jgi:hypothetical protein
LNANPIDKNATPRYGKEQFTKDKAINMPAGIMRPNLFWCFNYLGLSIKV